MPARLRPPSTASRFYSVKDLARIFDVCTRTIGCWAKSGQLPQPLRMGRWMGWPKEQIDAIASNPNAQPAEAPCPA
jgi:predicted DNA-binding transcriptional regulator AlpA